MPLCGRAALMECMERRQKNTAVGILLEQVCVQMPRGSIDRLKGAGHSLRPLIHSEGKARQILSEACLR